METLYFILGALSVVTLVSVVSAFRIESKILSKVDNRICEVEDDLSSYIEETHKDLESEIRNLERDYDERLVNLEKELYTEDQFIVSQMDSRFDKMENKIYDHVNGSIKNVRDDISKHLADQYSLINEMKND